MDPLRPEADAGLRARLRLALAEALRARDTIAVSALRSALGAIGTPRPSSPVRPRPPAPAARTSRERCLGWAPRRLPGAA